MKTKIIDNYRYEGIGFPVELRHVELIKLRGEWHPKIDVRKIADITIKKLARQQERLSGNQVKFIRNYFAMSLRAFAENVVKESHTAVSKWEKSGDEVSNMDINIEKMLRLYILDKMANPDNKEKEFYESYLALENICPTNKESSHIEIEHCL